MQVKGYFSFNVWFVVAIALIVAFILNACGSGKACPVQQNPICLLTGTIEEHSTCLPVDDPNNAAQYEAKVTLEDKAELYCQIVKKQGLVCKPVKDSPETTGARQAAQAIQQQQQAQAATGSAGSASPPAAGSASPPTPPKTAPPVKPSK